MAMLGGGRRRLSEKSNSVREQKRATAKVSHGPVLRWQGPTTLPRPPSMGEAVGK